MQCASCGTENPAGRKFCGGCGSLLARACPACGTPNEPQFAYCGECGSRLDALPGTGAAVTIPTQTVGSAAAKPERRLVSVLFADLVGFTTLSESRDAEDVRDLLTRYFETCRAVILRYGGRVEKFIGDAVMAVWGAPVANEDDAERAVRAALDVVAAVRELGRSLGADDLSARAGVLTGEAAVNLAATAEGLVAGDLVNSASRVQALATPGTVLVDDATRRATDAAIAYSSAGQHELRGKSEALELWQALRVVGGRGGALKSEGLEAPFVGRARELGVIKDLLHASAEQGVAHLATVSGIAGIGKSRLTWELFKYIDGLHDTIWWHRGRCLAYGEGVTYWALAEMIRGRAGIWEDESAQTAAAKLQACVREHVPDVDEQQWVLPRLASLLGLSDDTSAAPDAADLFSGWRLFFERMSQVHPVVLVFEDLHWADAALLDFIEYLLDWSRNHPIYVVTLARPELDEKRAGFGAGRRNVTALSLEPLPDDAMEELLDGLVPGLPESVRERIRERSEGVPLYAVETVRMLVDRGTLVRAGDRYEPVSSVDDLDVPETLQALIAARLDGLSDVERSLLQSASVLGKSFSAAALAAVSGRASEVEVAPVLAGLVRKELLGVQADLRSPERGQYAFLQSLVQKVAHDTLSKRDRRALHLAAAEYLQRHWAVDEGEVVQVIASHYLDAYLADPAAADAVQIRAQAQDFLTRAGERAALIAAHDEAQRYFLRAAEFTDDAATRADLLLRCGVAAITAGRADLGRERLRESADLFNDIGDVIGAARATKELAISTWWDSHDLDGATALLDQVAHSLAPSAPAEVRADVAAARGRLLFFVGRHTDALVALDEAIDVAEGERLLDVLSEALNTKALVLQTDNRFEEARSLLDGALRVALRSGAASSTLRAYSNLSYTAGVWDEFDDAAGYAREGLALARKIGWRREEWFLVGHLAADRMWTGQWDDIDDLAREVPSWHEVPDAATAELIIAGARRVVAAARGDIDELKRDDDLLARMIESADLQDRGCGLVHVATSAQAQGDHRRAIELAQRALTEAAPAMGIQHPVLRLAVAIIADSALALGDVAIVDKLLAELDATPVGHLSPFLRAQMARFHARVDATRLAPDDLVGAAAVEASFRTAAKILGEHQLVYYQAVVEGELAEWLGAQGRRDEAMTVAVPARDAFARLRVRSWQHRLAGLCPDTSVPAAAASG
ncbi:MAG TPA: adenylate/guanylate cyclase domain-containing protein [Mycobacteriales bacterium]|nr:adenylate/guanylate cyclase domain-containing protein [Mycobacteriales bacterium]